MRSTHLAAVDLNLLPLLRALLAERHVTRAARQVGLSQPAASRGLARLRQLLGDRLLVRRGGKLSLTPRAEALREPLQLALGMVEAALADAAPFDAKKIVRTVRVASDDYGSLVVLRPLVAKLSSASPGLDLRVLPAGPAGRARLLAGELELLFTLIDPGERLPPGLHAVSLADDRFVCMVAQGHPFAQRKPSIERFAGARHALIAPAGEAGGFVDDALAKLGYERRVPVILPHFMVMPFVIAASDLVLTLAERVAQAYANVLPVKLFSPPVELSGFATGFLWHERDRDDPAAAWLRGALSDLRADLVLDAASTRSSRRAKPFRVR